MKSLGNSALVWEWQGRSFALPISSADLLTLARAVDAEGSPKLAVAWTLLQRAAWVNSQHGPRPLADVVTSYAQPINPAWFPEGEKHQAEVARLTRLGDLDGVSKEKAKAWARKLKALKSWDELSPDTRDVMFSVFSGKSKSPVPQATHYWASRAPDFEGNQAAKPNLRLIDNGFGYRGNVFFAEKSKKNISRIQVVSSNRAVDKQEFFSVGLGLTLAWVAWKRRGKS